MAKTHLATPGVAAPTTTGNVSFDERRQKDIIGLRPLRRTGLGGDGKSASCDAQSKLFEESGVDTSVDDWDCAAAVFSGLHGGW